MLFTAPQISCQVKLIGVGWPMSANLRTRNCQPALSEQRRGEETTLTWFQAAMLGRASTFDKCGRYVMIAHTQAMAQGRSR